MQGYTQLRNSLKQQKENLIKKSGEYSDPRRALDVINYAELATMLPAETKKAEYFAKAFFTNQG